MIRKAKNKRIEERAQRFKKTPQKLPETMATIVVGGCANGVLLQDVRTDAHWIELGRPDYIKPLESAKQEMPEVVRETDKYEVHPIVLTDSGDNRSRMYGIAVVEGHELSWAFRTMAVGYIENVTNKLLAANLIATN